MKTEKQIRKELERQDKVAYDELGTNYLWTVNDAASKAVALRWVLGEGGMDDN